MRALAELGVAGWPLGVTLAAALVGDRVRKARRRAALNRALHELRRPLQALALAPAPPGRTRGASRGASWRSRRSTTSTTRSTAPRAPLAPSPGRLPGAGRGRRRALARSRRGGAPIARAALAGGGGDGDRRSRRVSPGARQPDRQRDRARRPAGARGGGDRRPRRADLGLRTRRSRLPARARRDPRRGHGLGWWPRSPRPTAAASSFSIRPAPGSRSWSCRSPRRRSRRRA